MVDGFDRLRHHAVVGRHDDDGDVCHSGTAGSHGRKGFVTRRIEEGDFLSVQFDTVSTDVLRDTAGLALDDVGFPDVVEQRCLTVVDMAHDRDDRRARHEVFLVVGFVGNGLLNVSRYEFDFVAELLGYHDQRFGVEPLVDRHHQTQVHAGRDDFGRRDIHHRCQFADGHEFRDLENGTFLFRTFHFLVHAFCYGFALVAAVLGTRVFGSFGRQTGQCILDLLRNLFVAHFRADDRFHAFVLLVAAAFARLRLILLRIPVASVRGVAVPVVAVRLAVALVAALDVGAALGHIDFLLLQALAFVTTARDESRNIHRTQYLRALQLFDIRTEHIVFRLVVGRFSRCCCGFGCRSSGLFGSCRCC